jgi:hypothetical protein
MTAPYYEKYMRSSASQLDAGEAEFMSFLEVLSVVDWESLLEAVLERSAHALDVVRAPHGEDPLGYLAQFMEGLARPERRLACTAIHRIVLAVLPAPGESPSAVFFQVLDVVDLIADQEIVQLLKGVVNDARISTEARVRAANALANHPDDIGDDFWLRLDVVRCPELAPAIVNGLNARSPARSLAVLSLLPALPYPPELLEYPVRATLSKLAAKPADQLGDFWGVAPVWLRELRSRLAPAKPGEAEETPRTQAFEAWRDRVSSYVENPWAVPPDMTGWTPEGSARFWDYFLIQWEPPLQSDQAIRLISLIPDNLSHASIERLLLLWQLGSPLEVGPDTLRPDLVALLWRRLLTQGAVWSFVATSTVKSNRFFVRSFSQVSTLALFHETLSHSELQGLFSAVPETHLLPLLQLVLEEASAAVALKALKSVRGQADARRLAGLLLSRLAAHTLLNRPGSSVEDLLLDGAAHAVAVKLYAYSPDIFLEGSISAPARLVVADGAAATTFHGLERQIRAAVRTSPPII